jgi:Tfp pilus assembly protein PilN
MFEINVHRETLERRRVARRKSMRLLFLRALYVTLVVLFTGLFTFQVLSLRQNIEARQEEMKEIGEMMARYSPEDLNIPADHMMALLQVKGMSIKWGEKLKRLCALLPEQMWLTQISLKNRIIEGINRNVFVIQGSTNLQDEHEGLNKVLEFLNSLRNDESFPKGFESIGLLSSKRSMTLEKKQLDFELVCTLR